MLVARLLSMAVAATAATISVDVGKGGLTFTPDSITAAKGDIVEFHFVGGYHDVVKGDFDKPCVPSVGGFASDTETGSATNVRKLTVAFFCILVHQCSTHFLSPPNTSVFASRKTSSA